MKTRIVLIASGFAVAFILLLIFGRALVFHDRARSSSGSQQAENHSRSPIGNPASSKSWSRNSQPTDIGQKDPLGTGLNAYPVPPPTLGSRLYRKLTEGPDPAANQLFTDCFRLMDQRNYREARSKLAGYMEGKAFTGNELTMPPAWWMLAWCILSEGGNKNLLDAAERFWICANLPGIGEHEELAKAAVFNRAAIYAGLLNTAEGEQKKYTENAVESLNLFLERWPDDRQSSEVRDMLDYLNASHPKP